MFIDVHLPKTKTSLNNLIEPDSSGIIKKKFKDQWGLMKITKIDFSLISTPIFAP